MPFKDYSEFTDPPIELPVNGKTYRLPPIGAKLGILLLSSFNGDAHATATLGTSTSLWQRVLGCTDACRASVNGEKCGSVYDQMMDDDVPMDVIARAGFTGLADFQYDRETAERVWESNLDPEARAALAAAVKEISKASQPSPDTDEASKIPSPASTTGTTSPTGSSPAKAPSRSSGSRSSRNKP